MRRTGVKWLLALAAAAAMIGPAAAGRAEEKSVMQVAVHTTVRKTGQYPEEIVVTFAEGAAPEQVKAEELYLTGAASAWMSRSTHSFTSDFERAEIDGSVLTLTPKEFPEKYFYVENWKIQSRTDPELLITSDDVTETTTETADLFADHEDAEHGFAWHEFTPEGDGPQPVVVVFHGYGDTSNLLTYRTAVAWAEPENQDKRPCTVMAVVIDDASYINPTRRDQVFEGVLAQIDARIEAGTVDPDRVYVMGNSFGGMSSLEFTEKYPDRVAGVLSLCPAVGYSGTAVQNLPQMADVPVWFAHAEHDGTIPCTDSETCLTALQEAGSTAAKRTVYTDEEMNAAGADPSPDATYSYHHVELAVMEDAAYMEWLFAQNRQDRR